MRPDDMEAVIDGAVAVQETLLDRFGGEAVETVGERFGQVLVLRQGDRRIAPERGITGVAHHEDEALDQHLRRHGYLQVRADLQCPDFAVRGHLP